MAHARLMLLGLGVLSAFALATCRLEPEQQDYTKRFPVGAQPETVTLTLGPGDAAGEAFDTLVAGYLDRGHGALTVSGAAIAQVRAVRARLIRAGIPASTIRTEPTAPAGGVTLSYRRYTIVLPACGDWSTQMTFNTSNADYPAFGCANQRDFGLMLADPADAVSMRPPQPTDAQNADRVIRAYRAGATPAARQSAIQDNADQNVATGSTNGASTAVPTSTR